MNIEELRDYCLSKKDVTESFPFNEVILVFKVSGKAFLLADIRNKPVRFNVKCEPDRAIQLREEYECVLPGYHMNKKYWNTVVADGSAPLRMLRQWIDESYELVAAGLPKKKSPKNPSRKTK